MRPGANNLRNFVNLKPEEKAVYYYYFFIPAFFISLFLIWQGVKQNDIIMTAFGLVVFYITGAGLMQTYSIKKKKGTKRIT